MGCKDVIIIDGLDQTKLLETIFCLRQEKTFPRSSEDSFDWLTDLLSLTYGGINKKQTGATSDASGN